jgi:replicative DNA helicase
MSEIYSLEYEKTILAGILQHQDVFPDISSILNSKDFSQKNSVIFQIIDNLSAQKEAINKVIVGERLKIMGISFDNLDGGTYINALSMMPVNKTVLQDVAKELKKYSVCRDIEDKGEKLKKLAKDGLAKSYNEITIESDKIYSKQTVSLGKNNGPESVYGDIEDVIEERGNNPTDDFGLMGPFDTINRIYGSLLRKGSITLIGARTGIGKTSFGFYYLTHVAEKYNLPILHLDFGEMTKEELQFRAVCMLAQGRIPLYYLETGYWRQNPEWVKIIRNEVWPRVKKLKMYYQNIGNMTPVEILSVIRRFYYNTVGRGNDFLTHYDYMKPFENAKNNPEWQVMGHFTQDIKTFITEEIPMSFWTSLQLNRFGITGNKAAGEIDDTENSFGVSDRIIQQTSHSFLLRFKTSFELEEDGVDFGNIKFINVKARHLGKDYQDHLHPVKLPNGKLCKNFTNIKVNNFTYSDMGDLKNMIIQRGETSVDLSKPGTVKQQPQIVSSKASSVLVDDDLPM